MVIRLAIVLTTTALAIACAGDQNRGPVEVPTFTRPDGSVIDFPGKPYVWCGPFVVEEGKTLPVETLYIQHGRFFGDDRYVAWTLDAVVADIDVDKELRLPTRGYVYTLPRGIYLGAWEENAKRELQTVSSEEGSEGTLTFHTVGCNRGDEVVFEVDAILGSELADHDRIRVRGRFRGRVGEPPPDRHD